jgi:hypothetical protein
VAHNAFAEEGGDAMKGAVDELVGNHKVGGLVLFLQRADGRDGENALDAELLECVDVGAEVQLRGQNAMAAPMPRQKRHLAALQLAQHKRVGGLAKGRLHALFAHVGESGHGVKPAAADDADLRLRQ